MAKLDWDKVNRSKQGVAREEPLETWENPYNPKVWEKNNLEGVRPAKRSTVVKKKPVKRKVDRAARVFR